MELSWLLYKKIEAEVLKKKAHDFEFIRVTK